MNEERIRKLGWDILFLPIVIFFAGYLKLLPAVLLLPVLGWSWYRIRKDIPPGGFRLPGRCVCLTCGIVLLWCILSGQGGFLPQKSDLLYRNTLFYDLIFREWPLQYASPEQQGVVSYYFLHWMVPAVFGKTGSAGGEYAGLLSGNAALFLWTGLLLAVTAALLLIHFRQQSLRGTLTVLGIFLLFSGMDWVGYVVFKGRFWGPHLEYWTHCQWQYSCPATLLGWVFNQAVPAWLILALYLREGGCGENRAVLAVMMLAYAPLPAIGFLPFPAFECLREWIRHRSGQWKQFFSARNLLFILLIFPVFAFFYAAAAEGESSGRLFFPSITDAEEAKMYVWFVLLEFLLMALLLWKENRKEPLFLLTAAELLLIPLGRLFFNTPDFCMRSSIPALFFLMAFLMKACFLKEKLSACRRVLLLLCFLLGAATPLAEWTETLSRIPGHSPELRKLYFSLERQKIIADRMVYPHGSEKFFFRHLCR